MECENEPECFDVIVIGGGPIGSTAARYAKLNGVSRVLMIEENSQVGIPVQCAGLLSVAALRESEVEPDDSFVLNSVIGADVYPPSGVRMQIKGKETMAYVVSRSAFDQKLAEMAEKSGVEIRLKTKAIGMKRGADPKKRTAVSDSKDNLKSADNLEMMTPKSNAPAQKKDVIDAEFEEQDGWILTVASSGVTQKMFSKIIIAADGANGRAAGWAGLLPCEKLLSGIQVDAEYESMDSDFVEVFVGSVAPGFFAWTIPMSDKSSRIGLAIDRDCAKKYSNDEKKANAKSFLTEFLARPEVAAKIKSEPMNLTAGNIPIGPMKKTYAEGFMVVGDAAGQCKPISGGGIYPGAVAAKIAGKVAAQAVLSNNFSEKKMSEYEKLWKKELKREFDIGMMAHGRREKMGDADMNAIFAELNDPEILAIINEYGDMDHPSVLIQKLMLSKHSWKMMKVFGAFLKSLI
ncbi:NAD(P)/FAD-dependent oxidoreductase [Methanolapillus millepedarum]